MKRKRLTRGQSIRAFCVECMGGDPHLPRECTVTRCPLWIYRTGAEQAIPDPENPRLLGSRHPNFPAREVA